MKDDLWWAILKAWFWPVPVRFRSVRFGNVVILTRPVHELQTRLRFSLLPKWTELMSRFSSVRYGGRVAYMRKYVHNIGLWRQTYIVSIFMYRPYGPRARGHIMRGCDGMFGWYDLLWQPLASMKMPLLSVPSGRQGHRSRSQFKWVHFWKNEKMFLFSDFIKQIIDTIILVTNKWRNWFTVSLLWRK